MKALRQFFGIHHVCSRYPRGFFLIVFSTFHKILLHFLQFGFLTHKDAFYLIWPVMRSKGGRTICLQSGQKVSSLNGFNIETWNVRRSLILDSNSNILWARLPSTLNCVLIRVKGCLPTFTTHPSLTCVSTFQMQNWWCRLHLKYLFSWGQCSTTLNATTL
jgi:hypothetical protein